MIVGFIHFIEKLLDGVVFLNRKQQQVGSAEVEAAIVVKCGLIAGDAHLDLVLRSSAGIDRRGTIRIIECVALRQINRDLVFFRPWVMEVDRIAPRARAE